MSNVPAHEFRTYTDTELRDLIAQARGSAGVVAKVQAYRMLRELAVRKSLRLEGKHVLVKAKI
jgi:hypothetical protein